jgi:FlaA1/EpsC-like NDP-sugar epimerase
MITVLKSRLVGLPRRHKQIILIAFDTLVLAFAIWASFSLRLDRLMVPHRINEVLAILAAPAVAIPVFARLGLYRAVVRFLPERAVWTMIQAVTGAVLLWVAFAFLVQIIGTMLVPRSVPFIYWALAAVLIVGSRLAAKWVFWPRQSALIKNRPAVAIYGAGEAGIALAGSLHATHFVAGFLDSREELQRREVGGLKVHDPSQLPTLVRDYGVKKVVLCAPELSPAERKLAVESLAGKGVTVQAVPDLVDIVSGKYIVSQIRDIEIDDLLGRSAVPPDLELVRKMVLGKSVMVTGAGGSIGSELCRKVTNWRAKRIVLFEANEFALYKIERELSQATDCEIVPVLASVTDRAAVEKALTQHHVDVLFHAAAHKHVPLVEANALEGMRNNVFGTLAVAEAALASDVSDFVLISTDKAVRPTNVMGATKRWAELIVQRAAVSARTRNLDKRFCAVRFGNVLGSNGSVVPLFREQIAAGGPITLTDRRMTRYFMSIHEAAELIVQAGALSDSGDVFLLDMGEPILISDLAENMVRLAGLSVRTENHPEGDIEIVDIGMRPGEKLFEELFYDDGEARQTRHPKILCGPEGTLPGLDTALSQLKAAIEAVDEPAARDLLFRIVGESDTSGRSLARAKSL